MMLKHHTKQEEDESTLCTQSWADRPKRAGSRGPIRTYTPGLEADEGVGYKQFKNIYSLAAGAEPEPGGCGEKGTLVQLS